MKKLYSLIGIVLSVLLAISVPVSVKAYDETEYVYLDSDSVVYARGYRSLDGSWDDPYFTGYYDFENPVNVNVCQGISSYPSKSGAYVYFVVDVPISSSLRYKMSQAESVTFNYCFYRNTDKQPYGSYIAVTATARGGYFDAYVNNQFTGISRSVDNSGFNEYSLASQSGHGLGKKTSWTLTGDSYSGSSFNTGYLYLGNRSSTSVSSNMSFDNLEIRTWSSLSYTDSDGNLIAYGDSQKGTANVNYTGFVMTITCHYADQSSAMVAAVGSQGSDLASIASAVTSAANSINSNISTSTVQITDTIYNSTNQITGAIDNATDQISNKIDSASETLEAAINGDGYNEDKLSNAVDDLSGKVDDLEDQEEVFEDFISQNLEVPTLTPSADQENTFTWVIGQINTIWDSLEPLHIVFYAFFFFFAVSYLIFGR